MSGKIRLNTSKVILNTDKIVFGTPVKTWVFLETSADSTLYLTPRVVIVSGASGCATVGEGLAGLESSFPAVDQTLGRYGRVTVYEPGLVPCSYFHWYTVGLV